MARRAELLYQLEDCTLDRRLNLDHAVVHDVPDAQRPGWPGRQLLSPGDRIRRRFVPPWLTLQETFHESLNGREMARDWAGDGIDVVVTSAVELVSGFI